MSFILRKTNHTSAKGMMFCVSIFVDERLIDEKCFDSEGERDDYIQQMKGGNQ